jgi:NADH:ubiquinone oxidoreductase subunit K
MEEVLRSLALFGPETALVAGLLLVVVVDSIGGPWRNAVNVLMSIELLLNAANVNLVAFSRYSAGNLGGQIFAVFVIVVAAAEVAVALAIVLTLYRLRRTPTLDLADILKG